MLTLGSLFNGLGGWPLAAIECGIKPLWSSEIDEFPVAVCKERFPDVTELGDITKINGAEIEPVDIICAGSPCQDLSTAGNRKGLDGERSGLFVHSVRIVREMREATNGKYPKWFVWENVPGAFSSNKGNDFRVVLEEITETEVPMPESGKWAKAGMVRSDKCYLAWRTLDAQYWGVPQRRARIFLVASFGKDRRPEVLFEPESVPWNTEESGEQGQEAPRDTRESTEEASRTYCIEDNGSRESHKGDGYKESDVMYTLNTVEKHAICTDKVYGLCSMNSNSMKSSNPDSGIYEANTTRTLDLNGGNPSCNQGGMMVVQGVATQSYHDMKLADKATTLRASGGNYGGGSENYALCKCIGNGQVHQLYLQDTVGALNCLSDQQKIIYSSIEGK